MEGEAADLRTNEDVKEFYLGLSTEGRKSFREVKHYRRRALAVVSRTSAPAQGDAHCLWRAGIDRAPPRVDRLQDSRPEAAPKEERGDP